MSRKINKLGDFMVASAFRSAVFAFIGRFFILEMKIFSALPL